MLWWAGLRGAVAFALAMQNTATEAHQTILTTTLVIVLVTVIVFGGSTEFALKKFKIPSSTSALEQPVQDDANNQPRRKPPKGWLAELWQGIDGRYIRPVLSKTEQNMAGTRTWSEVKMTVADFFSGRPSALRTLESVPLLKQNADTHRHTHKHTHTHTNTHTQLLLSCLLWQQQSVCTCVCVCVCVCVCECV